MFTAYSFKDGLKDGIPIAAGYFFVSAGFGITAVNYGLPVISAVIISLTNLTSAGQVAGIEILKDSAFGVLLTSAIEMLFTQLVINIRYSLMAISLSQKLDNTFDTKERLICGYAITDEIFAVAYAKKGLIGPAYMKGLACFPILGWVGGTAVGAIAASLIPAELSAIFGLAIYGMFLSIFVPDMKKDKGVALCVIISVALSCLLKYIPAFGFISSGFAIIICALVAAAAASLLFPVKDEEVQ